MMDHGHFQMTKKHEAILHTLIGISKTHNKFYCWASRETACLLIKKFHHLNVSPRTFSRRIKELEEAGYLVIVHRNPTEFGGWKRYTCNLYKFTKKLFLWLKSLGEYIRQVFSHFRMPTLAHYSLNTKRRDLKEAYGNVEILWKSPHEGRASPV